ncbi:MAG: long-subunit fatty acid transport protein [Saprospiraceae bacterium]|jgi:long-subunit fatty acid transport protein
MKRYFLFLPFFIVTFFAQGQTASDALRFSNFDVSGTARTIGVGGGLGALGADFSVVSTNPAGLAMFRTSEFIFSPSVYSSTTRSLLEDGNTAENKESKSRFNFSSIGYVNSTSPGHGSKWKTANISLGINQIANFNQTFFYSGTSEGSYSDRFLELAFDESGNPLTPDNLDQFEAGLAYETGAIYDPNDENGILEWANDFQWTRDLEVYKEQLVNTRGAINELNFSFAGNYNERLMIGASVGLPFVNFKEEKIYIEEDPDDEIPIFVASTFKENLSISGIGVNFKLGLIFRVNQTLRLGAAVHTPTAYNLTDNFSTELNYIFDVGNEPESFTGESPEGTFDYKLKSPWRYIGSAGVIIRKLGFLTAEIEYVDYSGAVFNLTANSSDPGDAAYQDEINQEISEDFTSALNFKLGGEYAYEMFRFRAGYGIYGTPYAEGKVVNHAISFGLGFRKERFYMDLAFRRLMIDEGYIPYTMSDMAKQQLVNNSINNDRIALTFGFKF